MHRDSGMKMSWPPRLGKLQRFAGGVRLGALSLVAMACGSDATCLALPCPFSAAAIVSVKSSTSSASVAGAFVNETAPAMSSQNLCNGDSCLVPGGAGTYELDVGAPGFTTVHLTLNVTGTTAKCSCNTVNTQTLSVTLVPIS